jgi:hypothetical protein
MTEQQELAALRALLRKVEGSPRAWASLSYVDGAHGRPPMWTPDERELLRRAGL